MIDNPENPSRDANNNEEEDFAAMLENHMSNVRDDLSVGEEIQGKVISIGDESIFIDTGTKVDGVVDKMELCDKEGQPGCQVGDIVKLYVVSMGDGEIRLSKSVSGPGSENRLYDAQKHRIPVEGKVTETCKGGFRVHIMGKTAFCPVSQIDVAYVEEPEAYIGKSFEFLITRIESRGKNIVVSRRDLLNRQIAEERQKFIETAKPGEIFDARVTRIMSYGVFAEVAPGVEGMIHISELGWSRVENPGDVVSVNDVVKVSLLGIEEGKDKSKSPKISLSMKHAMGDPWTDIFDRHQEGDRVRGTVTRCADFGAFVEIEPGVEGLVHISELSYKRVVRADDVVKPGEVVGVTIKSIDPAARRISLSMKDAEGDPWLHIAENYAIGQPTVGRIEKKEKFGYFVELEPGVTGLLPLSKIKGSAKANDIEKLKVGDTVTLTVDSIDVNNRKISLGLGDDAANADDSSWKNYKKEQPVQKADTGFGALGEKIKAAMEKNRKQ